VKCHVLSVDTHTTEGHFTFHVAPGGHALNEPLVIARAFHLASTLLLAGTIMFRCFVAAPAFRAKASGALEQGVRIRLTRIVWAALAVAVLSGAAWLVFVAAEIGGVSVADAMSEGLAGIVLTQTAFGDAWMLRLEMAALLAVLLLLPSPNPGFASATDVICAMLAAGLAASIAFAGHAAATEGFDGTVHLASDGLHLVAAGAWLGALWPLSILLGRAREAGDAASAAIAYQATRRFSILGVTSVAAILATGVVNTYEILGIMAFSIDSDYNRLLLAKLGLFAAMLAFAAYNRQRLTPRLADERDHRRAIRQLRRNSLAEVGLGFLILAIVAVLGRVAPHG
jgi:copper resistance protein D